MSNSKIFPDRVMIKTLAHLGRRLRRQGQGPALKAARNQQGCHCERCSGSATQYLQSLQDLKYIPTLLSC